MCCTKLSSTNVRSFAILFGIVIGGLLSLAALITGMILCIKETNPHIPEGLGLITTIIGFWIPSPIQYRKATKTKHIGNSSLLTNTISTTTSEEHDDSDE